MNHQEAAKTLKQFNDWRTDFHVPSKYQMPEPSEITKALNVAVSHLSQSKEKPTPKKVDPDNLPECEVLAVNKSKDMIVGYLSNLLMDGQNNIHCNSEGENLQNVTHYITIEELLSMLENENE